MRNTELPDLREVMHDLPQAVRILDDARWMLKKFGTNTFFFKRIIQRAVDATKPGERLYFIIPATTVIISDINGGIIVDDLTGAAFLSDERFYCIVKGTLDEFVFPVEEIHSIEALKGILFRGIIFNTEHYRVEIRSDANIPPHENIIRDILVHMIDNATRISQGSRQMVTNTTRNHRR